MHSGNRKGQTSHKAASHSHTGYGSCVCNAVTTAQNTNLGGTLQTHTVTLAPWGPGDCRFRVSCMPLMSQFLLRKSPGLGFETYPHNAWEGL